MVGTLTSRWSSHNGIVPSQQSLAPVERERERDRSAEKFCPRAEASMRSATARPEMIPEAFAAGLGP